MYLNLSITSNYEYEVPKKFPRRQLRCLGRFFSSLSLSFLNFSIIERRGIAIWLSRRIILICQMFVSPPSPHPLSPSFPSCSFCHSFIFSHSPFFLPLSHSLVQRDFEPFFGILHSYRSSDFFQGRHA